MRFKIYIGAGREYRWRLRAANNEIIASGVGYRQKSSVKHVICLIKKYAPDAVVIDETITPPYRYRPVC